jgi:hypothetical protein
MHPNVNELNSLPMALCRVSSNATVVLSLLVTAERPNRCPTIALTLVATVAMVAECLNCHSTHRLLHGSVHVVWGWMRVYRRRRGYGSLGRRPVQSVGKSRRYQTMADSGVWANRPGGLNNIGLEVSSASNSACCTNSLQPILFYAHWLCNSIGVILSNHKFFAIPVNWYFYLNFECKFSLQPIYFYAH